jgi:hypothetical protein
MFLAPNNPRKKFCGSFFSLILPSAIRKRIFRVILGKNMSPTVAGKEFFPTFASRLEEKCTDLEKSAIFQ